MIVIGRTTLCVLFVFLVSVIRTTESFSVGACLECNGTLVECEGNNSENGTFCGGFEQQYCYITISGNLDDLTVDMGCGSGQKCSQTMADLEECLKSGTLPCRACCDDEDYCARVPGRTTSPASTASQLQTQTTDQTGSTTAEGKSTETTSAKQQQTDAFESTHPVTSTVDTTTATPQVTSSDLSSSVTSRATSASTTTTAQVSSQTDSTTVSSSVSPSTTVTTNAGTEPITSTSQTTKTSASASATQTPDPSTSGVTEPTHGVSQSATASLPPSITWTALPSSVESSGTPSPSESSTSTALSTTTSTKTTTTGFATTPRNHRLTCLFCDNGEPAKYCLTNEFNITCESLDDVCFVTATDGGTKLSKGCKQRDTCESMQSVNDQECQYGNVSSSCTWCCEDHDDCNRGVEYLQRTTTVAALPSTTTNWSPVCDMVGYQECLLEFQRLVLQAAVNPDILFNEFCGSVPSVFRCLTQSMSDCACPGSDFERLNETLTGVLANMTAACPASCDPSAGFNCSMVFYLRVIDSFANGIDCLEIGSIDYEMERCKARNTGSCDVTVRDTLNITFSAIRREWNAICRHPPPALPPPDVTESSACSVEDAKLCILDLGIEIVKYYNYGGDLSEICDLLARKENCYWEIASTCSNFTRRGLDVAWNATRNLIVDQCALLVKPKCSTTAARACILDLWKLVEEAKDFQAACNLLPTTVQCVVYQTAGCSLAEQQSLNRSLQIVINDIGNKCDNTVEVYPNSTILTIKEGGNGSDIYYQFGGPPSSMCSQDHPDCRIFVEIDIEIGNNKNYPRCRNNKVISQAVLALPNGTTSDDLCSREVTASNWNVLQKVSIAAKLDFKYDGTQQRNLTVWIRKQDANGQTFERRSIKVYTLIIEDGDKSAVCSSVNDPHLTTFDKWYYNNFQEGFFILYRHMSNNFEVHIVTQRCNGQASCNCGVGVRSGDTVLFIDRCRKKSLIEKMKCKNKYDCKNLMKVSLMAHDRITPGTRMFSRNSGKEFTVWFPHGTVVKITIDGDYLNIWVTASPADWQNTEGLCGYYDGNFQNDLRLRDGTVSSEQAKGRGQQPVNFNNNWRVRGNEMIYTGASKSEYAPSLYCECRVNTSASSDDVITSTCNYNALLETCDWDSSGTEILIDSTYNDAPPSHGKPKSRGRFRRDTSDTAPAAPPSDFDVDPGYQGPSLNNTDRSAAEANCTRYFESISVYGLCQNAGIVADNSSFESCVDDIMYTGDYTWMRSALESFKEKCVQELSRNESIPGDVVNNVVSASCPNQCYQDFNRGNCINGTCACNEGFSGADCGFSLNAAIDFAETYNDGLCNVRESDCTRVQMLGIGFVPDVTTCKVQRITNEGVHVGEPTLVDLTFVSMNEVHCLLGNVTSAIVTLANGNSPGNSSLFVAHDAVCYKCIGNDTSVGPQCVKLADSCVIDEVCYGPGEISPDDNCLVCSPAKSSSAFSKSDSSDCNPQSSTNVGLIVGLSVGLSTAAIIAVIVIVSIALYRRLLTASGPITGGRGLNGQSYIDFEPPSYDTVDSSMKMTGRTSAVYELGSDNLYTFMASASTGELPAASRASTHSHQS